MGVTGSHDSSNHSIRRKKKPNCKSRADIYYCIHTLGVLICPMDACVHSDWPQRFLRFWLFDTQLKIAQFLYQMSDQKPIDTYYGSFA